MDSRADNTRRSGRTQEERSRATRERILDAMVAVIGRQGLSHASMSALIEEAGVSRGAIQHHFPTKASLVASAAQAITERVYSGLGQIAGLSIEERVKGAVSSLWRTFGSPDFGAAFQVEMGSLHDAPLGQALRDWYGPMGRDQDAEWVRIFADSGLPPQRLINLRRLTVDALRGMALRRLNRMDASLTEELDILCSLLVGELESGRIQVEPRRAG